jgi:uncharacterized membrane protein YebE (DUF533 family)
MTFVNALIYLGGVISIGAIVYTIYRLIKSNKTPPFAVPTPPPAPVPQPPVPPTPVPPKPHTGPTGPLN